MLLRMLFMFDYACTGGSRAIIQLLRNAATPVRADADVRVREAWFVSVHGTSVRCSLFDLLRAGVTHFAGGLKPWRLPEYQQVASGEVQFVPGNCI